MAPKYTLIAVDIDGTLLDASEEITPAVKAAVRKAVDAGATVALATGRRYRSALPFAKALALEYLICQHGSLVKRVSDNATILRKPLAADVAIETGGLITKAGFEPMYFVDAYESGVDVVFAVEPRRPGMREYAKLNPGIWRVGLDAMSGKPVVEVAAFDDRENLEALQANHERRGPAAVTKSHIMKVTHYSFAGLEIISRDAGKGNALMALADMLGIEHGRTAAIGDGVNDVEMLEAAGMSAAMGNASQALKNIADFTVAANDRDGAAEALDRIVAAR
jgi:Cof subfamily protein (haloacid dehalogenase superfamily)